MEQGATRQRARRNTRLALQLRHEHRAQKGRAQGNERDRRDPVDSPEADLQGRECLELPFTLMQPSIRLVR